MYTTSNVPVIAANTRSAVIVAPTYTKSLIPSVRYTDTGPAGRGGAEGVGVAVATGAADGEAVGAGDGEAGRGVAGAGDGVRVTWRKDAPAGVGVAFAVMPPGVLDVVGAGVAVAVALDAGAADTAAAAAVGVTGAA